MPEKKVFIRIRRDIIEFDIYILALAMTHSRKSEMSLFPLQDFILSVYFCSKNTIWKLRPLEKAWFLAFVYFYRP